MPVHLLYAPGIGNMLTNNITNLGSSDTTVVTMSLMSSLYTVDPEHQYFADVSANQISTGTDYPAGGVTVTLTSVATSGVDIVLNASTTGVQFCSSGSIIAYGAVIRNSSYLISGSTFSEEKKSVDGEFRVTIATSGIFRITASTV